MHDREERINFELDSGQILLVYKDCFLSLCQFPVTHIEFVECTRADGKDAEVVLNRHRSSIRISSKCNERVGIQNAGNTKDRNGGGGERVPRQQKESVLEKNTGI